MKKLHIVFWISFAVYSVLTFIGAVVVERNENDMGFLINMKGNIPLMKYYTLVGLIFFILAFLSMWRSRMRLSKTTNRFELEKKDLKALILDLKNKAADNSEEAENVGEPKPEG